MPDYKILDINGHEMKNGEFFKFVPAMRKVKPDGYQKPEFHNEGECKGTSNDWCGVTYIFDYGLCPHQETPYGDPVAGHFCAFTVIEDGVRGSSVTIKREAMRKEHYLTHDILWIESLAEKKPKEVRDRTAKAEALWAKTPADVQEKWMACQGDPERHRKASGGLDGESATIMGFDDFKLEIKAMAHDYYLEEHDGAGEMRLDVVGFDDEEKAVDHLLEADSKYGKWYLWKWDREKKKWCEAKIKRKGKALEVAWRPGSPG